MSSLRVLLIEKNVQEAERIASVLTEANHAVIPTNGFPEAAEALQVQRFDAVLVGSSSDGIAAFTNKLRQLEKKQRSTARTAVLSCAPDERGASTPAELGIDGFLPKEFEAATFSEAVSTLGRAVRSTPDGSGGISDLPVLEPEEFRAQVAHDDELLIEIIDLFLAERPEQVNEMRSALAASDYPRLGRGAHTIKGSLGSIHAQQARAHAQQLELAAKNQEDQVCRFSLAALEQDLDTLEPQLLALRELTSHQ